MQRQREILIAEDDQHIAAALCAIFDDFGHRVVRVVDTAEAAIRAAVERRFDLAVIDVWLANGSNGLVAVERLAVRHRIPAIVCSAHARAEESFAAGAAAFLEKPFCVADLERAVDAALAPPVWTGAPAAGITPAAAPGTWHTTPRRPPPARRS
ncbi:response regulator [Azospirillum halopraeferens]|uniref:response regulator n=1 Tax=Azospirillum halopraeferens TaxID=34010 RepID=UPI00146FB677|nr:response regulator [Azospirillum halopraeferens]